jgi:hypothetical protein
MNPQDRSTHLSAAELNRLHDQARHRAVALRIEAIDDFWRGANAVLWAQLSSARRAATRLSQRLQHHQQLRSATSR